MFTSPLSSLRKGKREYKSFTSTIVFRTKCSTDHGSGVGIGAGGGGGRGKKGASRPAPPPSPNLLVDVGPKALNLMNTQVRIMHAVQISQWSCTQINRSHS